MRSIRLLVLAALAASVLVLAPPPAAEAAAGVRYRDEVFAKTTVTMRDVEYGSAINHKGQREALRLDVHEPRGDKAAWRSAVVWIHGGYFVGGDKAEPYYANIVESLTRAGYVTVSINYRLDPTVPATLDQVVLSGQLDAFIDRARNAQHDAQAAIRWVRAHAAELRVDPDKVGVVGHSAGGLTSTMVAFNDEDPGNSGNPGWSSRPTAAVAMAGGGLPYKTVDIDTGEPPFQVVHGLADTVVPAVAFPGPCLVTIALLNVCEVVVDPDQDHGTFGLPQIRDFLYRYVATRPSLRVPANVTPVGVESLADPAALQHTVDNIVHLLEGVTAT
jgi:dienelactone hydrolase